MDISERGNGSFSRDDYGRDFRDRVESTIRDEAERSGGSRISFDRDTGHYTIHYEKDSISGGLEGHDHQGLTEVKDSEGKVIGYTKENGVMGRVREFFSDVCSRVKSFVRDTIDGIKRDFNVAKWKDDPMRAVRACFTVASCLIPSSGVVSSITKGVTRSITSVSIKPLTQAVVSASRLPISKLAGSAVYELAKNRAIAQGKHIIKESKDLSELKANVTGKIMYSNKYNETVADVLAYADKVCNDIKGVIQIGV